MGSTRRLSSIAKIALLSVSGCLTLSVAGCGSSDDGRANESETTRAIRAKVRADMDRERLERIGKRLAPMNEALASSPNAFMLSASEDEGHGEGEVDDRTPIERGEDAYTSNCSSCHGARGQGDGPLSASLVPAPAKHADGGYMNALTDEHLFKVIKQGGAAVGKSPMMAPWGTTFSDDEIQDIMIFVRSLAEPAYEG